ncbi:hypothetical protein JCM21900_003170 [Sporobolomyces salmonicolor]
MITRILADQYKPLRIKGYQKPTQKPSPLSHDLFADPPSPSVSHDNPPLNPWDVTFKPPDHYNPSVAPGLRSGTHRLPHLTRTRSSSAASNLTVKLVGGKPTAQKARLVSAYERSLDYRGGVRSSSSPGIAVPVHEQGSIDGEGKMGEMRAWEGFIEEKIKQAHRDGLFRNVKGRGKPIPKDDAESNPFISRDDFLINRIMKTQDAAPPWVEVQKELESSLAAFRTELRANWTRRALRIRSSEGLTPAVAREVAEGWKDPEWEAREKSYHETAIKALNDLVRKYNVVAPYHVRRPLLTLRTELDSTVASCAPSIASELQRRLSQGLVHPTQSRVVADGWDDGDGVRSITAQEMGGERKEVTESMWKAFRRVVVEVLGKGPDEHPRARSRVGSNKPRAG